MGESMKTRLREWRTGWLASASGKAGRLLRRTNLITAVLASIIVAAIVAFTAYVVLQHVLPQGVEPVQPKDLTQFSLTIVAGVGGVVALVVAYRRQQGIEQSRFVERFGAAASQLGHSDVAVRLAGVYAMAGVADEAGHRERQQCVDVLCGYLRLPYSSDSGSNHQAEMQRKLPAREGEESTIRYLYRQNDKEVRQTIVRVITSHLQRRAQESWSDCDFDFRGAVLEDADFGEAIFGGTWTKFDNSQFVGQKTSFSLAKCKRHASFDGAVFSSRATSFHQATFEWSVSFERAVFQSSDTDFSWASFAGSHTSFQGSVFRSKTSFYRAEFSAGGTSFRRSDFGSAQVSFYNPERWDPAPKFDWDEDLPDGERTAIPSNIFPQPPRWPPEMTPTSW
jgi:hypothetical protein